MNERPKSRIELAAEIMRKQNHAAPAEAEGKPEEGKPSLAGLLSKNEIDVTKRPK